MAHDEPPIRVLITDDNQVVRMGLRLLLDQEPDIEVVGEASSGAECVDMVGTLAPDVVLLDVRMPGDIDGVVTAGKIADATNILMFSHDRDPDVVRGALRSGASGYLVHGETQPVEIVAAVRTVKTRRRYVIGAAADALLDETAVGPVVRPSSDTKSSLGLSEREVEIVDRMAQGKSNGQIARELYIAPSTLKNHITRIFAKLGVTSRAEAIVKWIHHTDHPAERKPDR